MLVVHSIRWRCLCFRACRPMKTPLFRAMPLSGAKPAGVTELGRFSDRLSFIYTEHSRIDRDSNAVTLKTQTGTVHIPTAVLGALLLGPGTNVTHAAISLLCSSGSSLLWVGEEGVRLYAGTISTARTSRLLLRQASLVSNEKHRIAVARAMYGMRFPGEDVSRTPMQQLRGREGARVRALYRHHSDATGVAWSGRSYDRSNWASADPINRALSSANAALYGIVHAATLHLGCSPGLGFVHTGHQLSFVYDIADLYKADVTIPAAFECVAQSDDGVSSRARRMTRDRVVAVNLLDRLVIDIKALLGDPEPEKLPDEQLAEIASLWDQRSTVPGGMNYEATTL